MMVAAGDFKRDLYQLLHLQVLRLLGTESKTAPGRGAVDADFAAGYLLLKKLECTAHPLEKLRPRDRGQLGFRIVDVIDVDRVEAEVGAAHLEHCAEIARRHAMRTLDQLARPDQSAADVLLLEPRSRIGRHRAVERDVT